MFGIDIISTNACWVEIGRIEGCEAAYAAYRKACDLAESLDTTVALTNAETGEILALFEGFEDDSPAESQVFQGNSCDPEFGPMLSNEFGEI